MQRRGPCSWHPSHILWWIPRLACQGISGILGLVPLAILNKECDCSIDSWKSKDCGACAGPTRAREGRKITWSVTVWSHRALKKWSYDAWRQKVMADGNQLCASLIWISQCRNSLFNIITWCRSFNELEWIASHDLKLFTCLSLFFHRKHGIRGGHTQL